MMLAVKQEPMIDVNEQVVKLPAPAGNPKQVGSFVPLEVRGSGSGYVKKFCIIIYSNLIVVILGIWMLLLY